jgi:hypothetical protein
MDLFRFGGDFELEFILLVEELDLRRASMDQHRHALTPISYVRLYLLDPSISGPLATMEGNYIGFQMIEVPSPILAIVRASSGELIWIRVFSVDLCGGQ